MVFLKPEHETTTLRRNTVILSSPNISDTIIIILQLYLCKNDFYRANEQ